MSTGKIVLILAAPLKKEQIWSTDYMSHNPNQQASLTNHDDIFHVVHFYNEVADPHQTDRYRPSLVGFLTPIDTKTK